MRNRPANAFNPVLLRIGKLGNIRPPSGPSPLVGIAVDYQIRPLGKTCAATGEEFAPGQRVVSVVVERGDAHERLDFSEAAWNGPPDAMIGRWRCRVPESNDRPKSTLDPDAMLAYFEQLAEDANPAYDKLRYVLALFLLQKRRLQLDGSRVGDDGEFLELSGYKGEGPYEIRDQQLTEEEIRGLQGELAQAALG